MKWVCRSWPTVHTRFQHRVHTRYAPKGTPTAMNSGKLENRRCTPEGALTCPGYSGLGLTSSFRSSSLLWPSRQAAVAALAAAAAPQQAYCRRANRPPARPARSACSGLLFVSPSSDPSLALFYTVLELYSLHAKVNAKGARRLLQKLPKGWRALCAQPWHSMLRWQA